MRKTKIVLGCTVASATLSYLIPKTLEVYGVINQESYWLPYSILAVILSFLGILIWEYWPKIRQARKGVHRMILNVGLGVGIVGVLCLIVSAVLVVPRLSVSTIDTRIPLQVQLDTLIADLTAYKKTIPPFPMQNPNESWNDYTQRLMTYHDDVNADLVREFNPRIMDTIKKLHDFHIISDTAFQEEQRKVSSVATYASIYVGGLLDELVQNKADLDSFVEQLGVRESSSQ